MPTGEDVFWLAVGELYRLENATEETPDRPELAEWLKSSGRAEPTYSDVIELIAPDPATRRDYLAKHFEGIAPGPTHERIAELATRGLVTVFVTTNFDRLLERALQARGLEPVVVTSDADRAAAPPREHSACFVLKPHGDYLQQTIRNTAAELAILEPGVTEELQDVLDRYGIVVIGYSGSDEAIAEAMRARKSRYGLYWVARGELPVEARRVADTIGARVIVRPGAAEFVNDLERRLSVFTAQPSGLTATEVNDEALLLLRRGDSVGLGELLRGERREFEERVMNFVADRHDEHPTADLALACYDELTPALERRLGSLLPLILHSERRSPARSPRGPTSKTACHREVAMSSGTQSGVGAFGG